MEYSIGHQGAFSVVLAVPVSEPITGLRTNTLCDIDASCELAGRTQSPNGWIRVLVRSAPKCICLQPPFPMWTPMVILDAG